MKNLSETQRIPNSGFKNTLVNWALIKELFNSPFKSSVRENKIRLCLGRHFNIDLCRIYEKQF